MDNIALDELKQRYRIVGRDEKLYAALDTALQVARTDLSVLIQGESGVGKEVLPRIIHDNSLRKGHKYIAINCGSIPEGTIDSELFGHEKGSYTGALSEREGYFGSADGGTLFLDEVGELPMTTQARLLRVLETGEYIRVGSDQPRRTNVRIVAATNVDIPSAIRQGRFREDLFYRLCTINVKMPPLRERGYDAVLLFKHFASDTAIRYSIPEPIRLDAMAERVVTSYKWPGNVRQLKNIVEQMSILESTRTITPDTLSKYGILSGEGDSTMMARIGHTTSEGGRHDYDNELKWLLKQVMDLRSEVEGIKQILGTSTVPVQAPQLPAAQPLLPAAQAPIQHEVTVTSEPSRQEADIPHSAPVRSKDDYTFDLAEEVVEDDSLNLEEMEKRNIIRALQRCHNRRKAAAQMLGISERTLFRKIKDYDIEE